MGREVFGGKDGWGEANVGDVRVGCGGGCVENDGCKVVLEGVVADEAPGEMGEMEFIGDGA